MVLPRQHATSASLPRSGTEQKRVHAGAAPRAPPHMSFTPSLLKSWNCSVQYLTRGRRGQGGKAETGAAAKTWCGNQQAGRAGRVGKRAQANRSGGGQARSAARRLALCGNRSACTPLPAGPALCLHRPTAGISLVAPEVGILVCMGGEAGRGDRQQAHPSLARLLCCTLCGIACIACCAASPACIPFLACGPAQPRPSPASHSVPASQPSWFRPPARPPVSGLGPCLKLKQGRSWVWL